MTTIRAPITQVEAEILSAALQRQIAARVRDLGDEGKWAFGDQTSEKFKAPPDWVASVIRILYTGRASLIPKRSANAAEAFGKLGTIMGMAKMWGAVLNSPPADVAGLEKRFEKVSELRADLGKISSPAVRKIAHAEKLLDRVALKPELQLAYLKGKNEGAALILNEDGTMNDESVIRREVCFFLLIYWPEIQRLSTVSQLMEFFQQMRQDNVTKKNLEKICREVGLTFKRRGRPKNLLRKRPK